MQNVVCATCVTHAAHVLKMKTPLTLPAPQDTITPGSDRPWQTHGAGMLVLTQMIAVLIVNMRKYSMYS